MQFITRVKLWRAMVLGALLLLSTATGAQAGYTLQVFEDGVAQTGVLTPSGTALNSNYSFAHFDITLVSSFTTQSSGLTTLNTQLQAHLTGAGNHTVELKLVYDGYTLPVGSPLIVTTSGSANFGDSAAGDKATGQAWADAGNTNAFNTGTTAGVQTATSPGLTANGVVMNPNPASFMIGRSGAYSLKQDVAINLTADANTTGQANLLTTVQAVPAPNSAILALAGVPMIGLFGWLRRRKVNGQEMTMSVA